MPKRAACAGPGFTHIDGPKCSAGMLEGARQTKKASLVLEKKIRD